jgi:SAM-dependent methyltransferase
MHVTENPVLERLCRENPRWGKYYLANENFPLARANEVAAMIEVINPQSTDAIVEIGTGSGVLTIPIAGRLGQGILKSYDYRKKPIQELQGLVNEKTKSLSLPIIYGTYTEDYLLEDKDESVDTVAMLASLHHFDTRIIGRSSDAGRNKIIAECSRLLKKGGSIIIGDVAHGSNVQKYLDAMTPKYLSPNGHPHDFYTIDGMNELLKKHDFEHILSEIRSVPWQFKNEKDAAMYLNICHNAECCLEESLEFSKKHLEHTQNKGDYIIEWQLMYTRAVKK